MNTCPFSQESFLQPPAAARVTLGEDFMPNVYGDAFRRDVQARYPDIERATLDALELQRHLKPVIDLTMKSIVSADPRTFSEENCPQAGSLFDVRRGTQNGILDTAQASYDQSHPAGSLARDYHDQLAARYLSAKWSANLTALDRLEDGVGTAVHEPFKFFDALQHQAAAHLELQARGLEHDPGLLDVAGTARRSWRVIQAISQLDLGSYQFLTDAWFEPVDDGRGEIHTNIFNHSSKWLKLLQYNPEQQRYSLDIAPQALGRHAITLSSADEKTWETIITTGAERLRCPMTRLPESLTEGYVHFLVDVIVASGVWTAPDVKPMP